jgi:hypothetical protein
VDWKYGPDGGSWASETHGAVNKVPVTLGNSPSVLFQAGLDNGGSMITAIVGDYTTTTGSANVCVDLGGVAGT